MVNVNFIGRLGRDAEIKKSQNGNEFLQLNVATDEFIRGEKTTSWLSVAYSGERALKIAPYLTKGKLVNIIGSETVALFQRHDGQYGIDRRVNADKIDFVNGGSGHTASDQAAATTDCGQLQQPMRTDPIPQQATMASTQVDDDDDLPF